VAHGGDDPAGAAHRVYPLHGIAGDGDGLIELTEPSQDRPCSRCGYGGRLQRRRSQVKRAAVSAALPCPVANTTIRSCDMRSAGPKKSVRNCFDPPLPRGLDWSTWFMSRNQRRSTQRGSSTKAPRNAGGRAALAGPAVDTRVSQTAPPRSAARVPAHHPVHDCIDWFAVNTGTIPGRSRCPKAVRMGGIDASSIEGAGWGGGPVVVRAHERRVHGEEGQQVSSGGPGRPGVRW
jgi:hypothetical protein